MTCMHADLMQVSQSSGIKDVTTMLAYSEELDPLRELYPHVSALQRQSNNEYFTEYSPSCWAEAYSMQHSLEEGSTKLSLRRISGVYQPSTQLS